MLRREEKIRLLEIAAEAGAPEFALVEAASRMEAWILGHPVQPVRLGVVNPASQERQH